MKKYLIALFVGMAMLGTVVAQEFTKGRNMVIHPLQVLVEQFTPVAFPIEYQNSVASNQFDRANLYTYIQLITNSARMEYQVLYQTDFFGKILFLAYSNGLSAIFNKKEKPVFALQKCISEINHNLFSVQNSETAIDCIIDRLNYCSD